MCRSTFAIPGLTIEGCRGRQQLLVERLRLLELEGAFITDRRHVYYFSRYWAPTCYQPILFVSADGETQLTLPDCIEQSPLAAGKLRRYRSQLLGTLVEDQWHASLQELDGLPQSMEKLGVDSPSVSQLLNHEVIDLSGELLKLRRTKTDDEVELVRCAIRGCEAAYARARGVIMPGIREIDVFAEMQAAAVKEIGEPLGEMGNDFQAGTAGGPPRARAVQAGELMPLDVSVTVRGYRCDLCRTFAVDGSPSPIQKEAAEVVATALAYVERNARVGVGCRSLYEDIFQVLDGHRGWSFPHHLGHGIGLSTHEAPRLNPNWNDILQIGDLIAVEPGLYHDQLCAGVRIEQDYWLTSSGLECLSSYPIDL